ncbi:Hpt domain-containing protein [Desulfosediminicola sp.]|uniref:Hpt domain-containing protein n=1 Tax=Desulfosediminicola sp. TaxID=2886825 RepID=UPI003AF25A37
MAAVTVYVDIDLKEIIPLFLESRQEDIVKMRRAITECDFDKVARIGHTLKGVGGGYGFDFITDIGREIESAAKDENSQVISKLVKTMEESLANIEIIYEE